MNHHLLKLDMTSVDLYSIIQILLIILVIHSIAVFIYGLVRRDEEDIITPIYVVTYIIYSILQDILTLLIFVGFLLLGNVGGIVFLVLYVVIFFDGFFRLINEDAVFMFSIGKIPEWISDNYYAKRSYYTKLNNDYKQFKQYNEEII